ncbi:MAG: type I 3-dehydroquinate dehydratase [Candidatus Cloacimonetes bacterium]|nr:type I 3-dehydroquinate dehydratase [Candidatus Cloacimonadota bacterium]
MLIVSIPYINDNFLNEQIAVIPEEYYVEYRLDYNDNFESFPLSLCNDKTIITIKNNSSVKNLAHRRKEFLKKVYLNTQAYIDLDIELISDFSEFCGKRVVLSAHFEKGVDLYRIQQVTDYANKFRPVFLKIALFLEKLEDFRILKSINETVDVPAVLIALGRFSKMSRLMYPIWNSKATYLGIEGYLTAENQLSLDEAEFYKLASVDKKTLFGGIVGGEQILHSKGLPFYNEYFYQNGVNARYIPFIIKDSAGYVKFLQIFKNHFFGFSVTMPFKLVLAKMYGKKAINLIAPRLGRVFNTDFDAFRYALKKLEVSPDDKILILGAGGTARAFAGISGEFRYRYLWARNPDVMILEYPEVTVCSQDELLNLKFDLIVNCTPLGIHEGEEIFFDRITFSKAIDLPYLPDRDTGLIKLCLERKLEFFDGHEFWLKQSEKQLAIFSEEIDRMKH